MPPPPSPPPPPSLPPLPHLDGLGCVSLSPIRRLWLLSPSPIGCVWFVSSSFPHRLLINYFPCPHWLPMISSPRPSSAAYMVWLISPAPIGWLWVCLTSPTDNDLSDLPTDRSPSSSSPAVVRDLCRICILAQIQPRTHALHREIMQRCAGPTRARSYQIGNI